MDNFFLERINICNNCEYKTNNWMCSAVNPNINLLTENKKKNFSCPKNKFTELPLITVPDSSGSDCNDQEEGKLPYKFKTSLNNTRHKSTINENSSVEDIYQILLDSWNSPGGWPVDFYKWPNTQEAFRLLSSLEAKKCLNLNYCKDRFQGRGIVTSGGGKKYFPSLYVNLRILRLLGCKLPVEVFYLGHDEMDHRMIKILENIEGVKCINGRRLEEIYPIRIHTGWESKVYSIINSSFEEVLFLDADNTPLVDPSFLFEDNRYKDFGAILWPDYDCWKHDENIWKILGLNYIEEPQIESGQVLVNKSKCWSEINMAMYYCNYSDYYFKLFYGDKEAFHFGWRYLGSDYARPPSPEWIENAVIVQRNFDTSWLFSHRAQAKFKYDKSHKKCFSVPHEQDTLELLDELRLLWNNEIWINKNPNNIEKVFIESMSNKRYKYVRKLLDYRDLVLGKNYKIDFGSDRMERYWYIFEENDEFYMSIHGDSELTAILKYNQLENKWTGKWINYERCEVEIIPYE